MSVVGAWNYIFERTSLLVHWVLKVKGYIEVIIHWLSALGDIIKLIGNRILKLGADLVFTIVAPPACSMDERIEVM